MAIDTPSATGVWQETLRRIEGRLTKPSYESFVKAMAPISLQGDVFVFAVPSRLAKEWVETRYAGMIHGALRAILSRSVSIQLTVLAEAPQAPPRRATSRP